MQKSVTEQNICNIAVLKAAIALIMCFLLVLGSEVNPIPFPCGLSSRMRFTIWGIANSIRFFITQAFSVITDIPDTSLPVNKYVAERFFTFVWDYLVSNRGFIMV